MILRALWLLGMWAATVPVAAAQDNPVYAQVRAIFEARCIVCHRGAGAPLGLRLDTYEGIKRGSDRGAVVVPGKPQDSELVQRIRGTRVPRMPLTGPPFLSEPEIALIEGWIAQGLPAPAADDGPVAAAHALPAPGETVRFDDVAPLLLQRCVKCHSDNGIMGPPPEGLKLTTWREIVVAGERAVVIPGNPAASELIRRIKGQSLPRMPFDGPPYLSEGEVRVLADWVAQGAPDAMGNPAPVPVGKRVRLEGTLTGRWQLDDLPLVLSPGVRLKEAPRIGDRVEVRGVARADGTIEVNRLRKR